VQSDGRGGTSAESTRESITTVAGRVGFEDPAYFSRVVMTAEMFGPAEAVTAGFFDRVVPSDQLEKAADETAQALSKLRVAFHF